MIKNNKIIFLFSFLFLFSCQEKQELEMEKMADLYVDLLVADQTHTNNLDSLRYYKNLVYNEHGITKADFEDTFRAYKSDEEKWDKFFDMALARVDTLEEIRKQNDTR